MNRPFRALVDIAGSELKTQITQDTVLLQAEMKAKIAVILSTAVYSGVALFCMGLGALAGVATLILFLVWLGLAPVVSALIVTVALFLVGGAFLMRARALMKGWTVLPERTIAAIRADVASLKEAVANVAS